MRPFLLICTQLSAAPTCNAYRDWWRQLLGAERHDSYSMRLADGSGAPLEVLPRRPPLLITPELYRANCDYVGGVFRLLGCSG